MNRSRPVPAGSFARWRSAWVGVLALAGSQACLAQAADVAAIRSEIAEQRASAELRHQQQRSDCSRRFLVTACMEDARAAYRATIGGLDQREAEIDRRLRQQRAEQRLAIIRQKTEALGRLAPLPAIERVGNGGLPMGDQPGGSRTSRGEIDLPASPGALADREGRARAEAAERRRSDARRLRSEREPVRAGGQQNPAPAGLPERPPIPPQKD